MSSTNRGGTRLLAALAAALSMTTLVACAAGGVRSPAPPPAASTPAAPAAPKTIGPTYSPTIDPADFSTTIDNPYLPLTPGTRMIFEGRSAEGFERITTEVTRDTKMVMGVQTVVVHDTVTLDGKPLEDTFDWYAQHRDGSVWYFGEDTRMFEGNTVDTAGSFEGGVDGALPGIIMQGRPVVGDQYRQEYAVGIAEDTAEVLSLSGTESVPLGGPQQDLLVTKDVNPLDPEAAVENKYYARGVGNLLVLHVTGPAERVELVKVERF